MPGASMWARSCVRPWPVREIDALGTVVGLARTLRAAGVAASPDRVAELVRCLGVLNPARRSDVYWCGRFTLCAGPADFDRYDRAFRAFFDGEVTRGDTRRTTATRAVVRTALVDRQALPADGEETQPSPLTAGASATEVLRERDVTALTDTERREVERLLAVLRLPGQARRSRRMRPANRGPVDRPRTVRAALRGGDDPQQLLRHRARRRPRRVVLLIDVSGSMSAYAMALLRFAHAAARRGDVPTEVFTLGTRLTRVSSELRVRDPDAAMAAVAGAVPDYSGGTRLGVLVKEFCDRWGQRGMARGAVVVILSDGWERGDPTVLGEQMARLSRLAHRVVWANPLKGRHGYEPLTAGMLAALPHVDDFVAGHSLAALERLARVVAGEASKPNRSSSSEAVGHKTGDRHA